MKKNLRILNPYSFFFFLLLTLSSKNLCGQKATSNAPSDIKFPEAGKFKSTEITYKIISVAQNTFCYDIFSDGKLLIHQPSVPGMPGNKGFKNKESAVKVAQLVITKIKNGEMPPTITTDELKKLKAVY